LGIETIDLCRLKLTWTSHGERHAE
jgi:hypothetical protein